MKIQTLAKVMGILSSVFLISMNVNAGRTNKAFRVTGGTFNFQITVPIDSNNTSGIHINLASTDSTANDLMNYTFVYGSNSVPSGTSYTRNGNIVTLILGQFVTDTQLWGTYSVIDKAGNSQPAQSFMYK